MIQFALDILFPKFCFGCNIERTYLCEACQNKLVTISLKKQICIVCRKSSFEGKTHLSCKTKFVADQLITILPYQHPVISKSVIQGKYYFIPEIFSVLGMLASKAVIESKLISQFDDYTITSIPLHTKRKRWRGFNQSAVLANTLSKKLNIKYTPLLVRTKNTKTQKDLSKQARLTNMKQSFSIINSEALPQKVILIDDVITTGSTLKEAVYTLKKAGAQSVIALCIAHEEPRGTMRY